MERKENINIKTQGRRAWYKFRGNFTALAGLLFIVAMMMVSIFGVLLRPDKSINANAQHLEISKQAPGFEVDILYFGGAPEHGFATWLNGGVDDERFCVAVSEVRYNMSSRPVAYRAYGSKDWIDCPEGEISIAHKKFYLGTDKYGRDLLSRLLAGVKISLGVGVVAVFVSLLVGLLLGLVAGYYRGWVDNLIMWFTNVVWAVPTLLLVMAITFAFGTGLWKVFLAVGLTMWVEVARITRGQVLSVREKEYIEAARALGFSDLRIMFRHILPNIWSPIIVISAANFASAILIEAGLSFLGLGAQIPVPSWGNMIREHYAFITTDLAYLAIVPGLMIMLLVLSFMMVGNGLRDALDVKS
ncbi:MAG: ABC transporter permease [Flavobacteriales bacterium]|jgi:peptide/nickel transport system permease protein